MVNHDDNEYEFSELDLTSAEPLDEQAEDNVYNSEITAPPETNIIRNVAIVCGLIILLVLLYKFVGSFYQQKTSDADIVSPSQPPVQSTPVIQTAPVNPVVVQTPMGDNSDSEANKELNNKLSALESAQQSLNSDMSNTTSQINTLSLNIANLTSKMNSMSQALDMLSAKLESQSDQFNNFLLEQEKKAKAKKVVAKNIPAPIVYYIQAVIPGRAWLIATNGSTLTVREGSQVKGYGSIKLIDPSQGRILTSSGRIIRFSQQDS